MGIIWRFIMVLLSTLAALVIIVHTAEEDIELTYRRGLQPRDFDNETLYYDQNWRLGETDINAQKTLQLPANPWNNNSPEDRPKRRRPGRKRKRRPQQPKPSEEPIIQDVNTSTESPQQPLVESDDKNVQERRTPKRRRKKIHQNSNESHGETLERPLRKRGHRRKRPSLNTWPELSEFSIQQPEEIRLGSVLGPTEVTDDRIYTDTEGIRQLIEQNQSSNDDQLEIKTVRSLIKLREKIENIHESNQPMTRVSTKEDKSLSEFSFELPDYDKQSKINDLTVSKTDNFPRKFHDESFGGERNFNKVQDHGPMDPLTLKDILKRSNGTSLSEILQKHNLSLGDLLSGRENAISILNAADSFENQTPRTIETQNQNKERDQSVTDYREINVAKTESKEENVFINLETKHGATRLIFNNEITTPPNNKSYLNEENKNDNEHLSETIVNSESTPKLVTRKKISGNRKRLRMRPMMNSTYKNQLSRDLLTLSPRQQIRQTQRNFTKPIESRDFASTLKTNDTRGTIVHENIKHIRNLNEATNTLSDFSNRPTFDIISSRTSFNNKNREDTVIPITETNVDTTETARETIKMIEKPVIIPVVRHSVNSSMLRQQAFNNRMKKRRQKNKNTTTESPHENTSRHSSTNHISITDFIERTQVPAVLENKGINTSEDFLPTISPQEMHNLSTSVHSDKDIILSTTNTNPYASSSTEETARIEIEEVLNDIRTSAKLSEILNERNMTLSELVELRERGSSNIHLADIFHNTSKEPNPPVPFLSKSLIEPISKETYPLRALLEGNLHETNAKSAISDPGQSFINIPVVMNFGNNVNENAENMGIMSLFRNVTKHDNIKQEKYKQESDGTHETIVKIVNNTQNKNSNTIRNGKMISEDNNQDDIGSWDEIFTLMRKTYKNETGTVPETLEGGQTPVEPFKKLSLDDDIDADGLIILEDLQHLKEFDSQAGTHENEKVEVTTYERIESATEVPGILDKIPSQTKSVSVATACIAGLAIVLFLLTYAAFKWKQEKKSLQKRDVEGENIPTPVFENRKGHKNNSSMRSISPMLSTSNIYTLNTLDSRNGKESPEYMWDTLQKPFQ